MADTALPPDYNSTKMADTVLPPDYNSTKMADPALPPDYNSTKMDDKRENDLPPKSKLTCFTLTLSFLSAIGGFLFGYDTGVVSGILVLLKVHFKMSYKVEEVFVSITMGAAMLFALVAGVTTDLIGRKPTIMMASVVFMLASVVLAAARDVTTLLVGRFIIGIGIGLSSMTTPMYIAECAPKALRGRLVTLFNLFITFGILVAAIVCGLFSKDRVHGFRYVLGLAAFPALVQFVFFIFMPESPRWLVGKGRLDEARFYLEKIEGVEQGMVDRSVVEDELADIQKSVDENRENEHKNFIGTLLQVRVTPHVRRALAIGAFLQLVQQITAINSIMYYGATLIQMSGMEDPETAIWLAVVIASVNFLATFITMIAIDRCGRRPLTLISLFGTMIGLLIVGGGFWLTEVYSPPVSLNLTTAEPCAGYGTCGSCVSQQECSFCYQPNDDQILHSFCYPKQYKERHSDHENGDKTTLEFIETSLDSDEKCARVFNSSKLATVVGSKVTELSWSVTLQYCHAPFTWVAIVGMVIYLLFFAPGMGPNPWTINSEIYPSWARSTCVSIATSVNWLSNMVISLTFLSLMRAITFYGAFYFYALLMLLSLIILYLILPETKNKKLEEIEKLFKGDLVVVDLCNKRSGYSGDL